jgi:hypothetical protein
MHPFAAFELEPRTRWMVGPKSTNEVLDWQAGKPSASPLAFRVIVPEAVNALQ